MKWTKSEEESLERLYPILTNKDLSEIFRRTEHALKRKGSNMGYKKLVNPSRVAPFHKNIRTIEVVKKREATKLIRRKYGIKDIIAKLNTHPGIGKF